MNDLKFTTAGDYMNTKMVELTDYELIPNPDDSHAWQIRILTGEFTETIIEFGTISFNEVKEHFTFDFKLISSPDKFLSIDDEGLHHVLARVLEDIIERGEKEGWVKIDDKKNILAGDNIEIGH